MIAKKRGLVADLFGRLRTGNQTSRLQIRIVSHNHSIVLSELQIHFDPVGALFRRGTKGGNHVFGPIEGPSVSKNFHFAEIVTNQRVDFIGPIRQKGLWPSRERSAVDKDQGQAENDKQICFHGQDV
jgi:hypothetical protein